MFRWRRPRVVDQRVIDECNSLLLDINPQHMQMNCCDEDADGLEQIKPFPAQQSSVYGLAFPPKKGRGIKKWFRRRFSRPSVISQGIVDDTKDLILKLHELDEATSVTNSPDVSLASVKSNVTVTEVKPSAEVTPSDVERPAIAVKVRPATAATPRVGSGIITNPAARQPTAVTPRVGSLIATNPSVRPSTPRKPFKSSTAVLTKIPGRLSLVTQLEPEEVEGASEYELKMKLQGKLLANLIDNMGRKRSEPRKPRASLAERESWWNMMGTSIINS